MGAVQACAGLGGGGARIRGSDRSRSHRRRRMGEDRRVNRLFCFGLGFTAETLARRLAAKGWSIAGTVRDPANLERLRGQGYEVCRFAGEPGNTELLPALAGTTHFLHSIPPGGEGDPVLRQYRA